MDKSQIALESFVPTVGDTSEVLEPGEETFNLPSSAVAAELAAVLADVHSITFVRRD